MEGGRVLTGWSGLGGAIRKAFLGRAHSSWKDRSSLPEACIVIPVGRVQKLKRRGRRHQMQVETVLGGDWVSGQEPSLQLVYG